jgi:hypothetical protein
MGAGHPKDEEYNLYLQSEIIALLAKGGKIGTIYRFGMQNMPKRKLKTIP